MHTRTAMKAMVAWFAAALFLFPGASPAQQSGKQPVAVARKPTVLVVYADWCPMCQKLKPVISAIADKYRGKIQFVRYDITSSGTEYESKQRAQKLGFEGFFAKNREATSLVVILDSAGHEELRVHSDYDPQHYEAVLDRLLQAER